MIETGSVYVIKSMEDVEIGDKRLVEILLHEESIRNASRSRAEILARIQMTKDADNPTTEMERLMMAYFAGNQSKNPRKIVKFSVHKMEMA